MTVISFDTAPYTVYIYIINMLRLYCECARMCNVQSQSQRFIHVFFLLMLSASDKTALVKTMVFQTKNL